MIIKKITMSNFRQYINSEVEFSSDPDKNITLVMGDNGTGKTTLAQAFLWCLYADTDFEIKEVINRKVRDKLPPGGRASASVKLLVNYNDTDYTIERTQIFTKVQTKVNADKPELKIYYKKDGNLTYMTDTEKHMLIKHMLPQQLSRFFFFDGERIRVMSDEINHGKSKEFKDAVTGLVGLNSIQNAIQHLKPSNTPATVIGYYRKQLAESGGSDLKNLNAEIEKLNKEKESIEKRLKEIEPQIESYEKDIVEQKAIILSAQPAIELKNQYKEKQRELQGLEKRRLEKIENGILSGFGVHLYDFIAAAIVNKTNPELEKIKESKVDIPVGIEGPTLAALIKRGKCICGEPLIPGDDHFKAIMDLMDVAPPKTTGKYVEEMKLRNKGVIRNQNGIFDRFKDQIKDYRDINDRINVKQQEVTNLFNRLSDTGEGEKAKAKLEEYTQEKKKLEREQLSKTADLKVKEQEIGKKNKELESLANMNFQNERNIRYLAYAEYLFDRFSKRYAILEEKTRYKLEEKINEIFPEIYDGGMRIEVDDKYNIKVLVDDNELSNEEVEKNTAQSYSVIFAFISSIIAMAKEKVLTDDTMTEEEKEIFSEAEGYPLVMDAPLSNFDKTRIEQICTIIPSIAKQVVFFIKDTDGEVAEEHMKAKIGRKYIINEKDGSKTHSVIEEVK